MSDGYVYGIDLGTTNCVCARTEIGDQRVEVLPIEPAGQSSLLLSAGWFEHQQDGRLRAIIGKKAIELGVAARNPGVLVQNAKRFIGRSGADARCWTLGSESLDPVEVSAVILKKIKREVENYTQEPLGPTIVTHPRDFLEPQKRATAQAAQAAGISLLETIDEPVAAFYSYLEPGGSHDPGTYLVFDLGGGTLDIALLDVPERGTIRVIGGDGISRLGGQDWDDAMLEEIFRSAEAHHGADGFSYRTDISPRTVHELRRRAELWKIQAATRRADDTLVIRGFSTRLRDGNEVPTNITVELTRWVERCQPLVARCDQAIDSALASAKILPQDVTRVLPVGGSTRLRSIRELLGKRFGNRVEPLSEQVDLAVAMGAARFASCLACKDQAERSAAKHPAARLRAMEDLRIQTILPRGINVLAASERDQSRDVLVPLVEKGRPIPCAVQKRFVVTEAGERIAVDVYEGPPGEVPPGVTPTTTIWLPPALAGRSGDTVTMTVHVTESGRISVTARHDPSGQERSATLDSGTTPDGAGAGQDAAARWLGRIARIEVE